MTNEVSEALPERGMPSVNDRKGGTRGIAIFLLLLVLVLCVGGGAAYYGLTRLKGAAQAQVAPKDKEEEPVRTRRFSEVPAPSEEEIAASASNSAPVAEAKIPAIGSTTPGTNIPVVQTGGATSIPLAGTKAQGDITSIPQKPGPSPYDTPFAVNGGVQPSSVATGATGGSEALQQAQAASSLSLRGDGGKGAMTGILSPTYTPSVKAGLLGNPNLTVSEGTTAECILRTKIVASLPGMVVCRLASAIYSANGKVVLADRGSLVTGEQSGQLKQGQNRLFILWRRIETPEHVVIKIDAPAADSLGASGIDGEVDNHWPERIGAALMLSIVSDVFAYQTAKDSGVNVSAAGQSSGFNAQGTQRSSQGIAEKVLESTINIPPTLTRNQGDKVLIMIPRDLDFSSVYDLQAR